MKLDDFLKDAPGGGAELAKLHPCLGAGANSRFGRLHLPVSPACNIQCRFCSRAFNKTENRPGVSDGLLKPEDAVAYVGKALELCPEITVAGIAGPGDTLATGHALQTFRLVHEAYPELINCLSTNGLLLPEKAEELIEVGVRTVTVTVNAVDPAILEKIISHVIYEGFAYRGRAAAELLISQQLKGIRRISGLGAVVKVNTVLIPGINDGHIADIARTVSENGAVLYNIIPLIPQHEFKNLPAPDCESVNRARAEAEEYIDVFRHCTHCRADACGIPGKSEFSGKLYSFRVAETFSHG
jgi:nitrogen fixation protein NifB